jgi:hypothetical protein
MTFEHDQSADVLWVSLSEPAHKCAYMESQTPGVILRVEASTGVIRGFRILAWTRRVAVGPVLIPEIVDPNFQEEWLKMTQNQAK